MSRIRSCVFTLNNYNDEQYTAICKLNYKYIVIAKEVGELGTPHLQGYLEFKNALSFKSLCKKLFKAHIEQRRGTPKEAAGYCKKGPAKTWPMEATGWDYYFDNPHPEAIYFEEGTISEQGKRTDIEKVVDFIKDGNNIKDVAKHHSIEYVKYHKGFEKLCNTLIEPRNEKPMVTVYYGPTGTGKSHTARALPMKSEDYYVWTPARGKWWDGYSGQKTIIMEEFRGQLNLPYMLTLLDKYECPIEYKGGTTEFVGIDIRITSPEHPENWYKDWETGQNKDDEDIEQLLRRIDAIIHLKDKYIEPDSCNIN